MNLIVYFIGIFVSIPIWIKYLYVDENIEVLTVEDLVLLFILGSIWPIFLLVGMPILFLMFLDEKWNKIKNKPIYVKRDEREVFKQDLSKIVNGEKK